MEDIVGFENCHNHSFFSLLDGVQSPDEMGMRLKQINQKYMVCTDHGSMAVVPNQIRVCEQYKLEPIFGVEIYYNEKQPCVQRGETMKQYLDHMSPDEKAVMRKSNHMTLWAKNATGYKNLVRLTSWGHLHGFYYKPRINWEQLSTHAEGVMAGSGCYGSPIASAWEHKGPDAAIDEIKRYKDLFGENYYLEIILLDFIKQKAYNQFLIQAHDKLGVPLVVTQDAHYANKDDSKLQMLMLLTSSKRTISDVQQAVAAGKEIFEFQDTNLWMKSEEELNEKWASDPYIDKDIFQEAKRNSLKICESCKGVKLDRSVKLPKFPNEEEMLKQLVKEGAIKRGVPKTHEYLSRIQDEYTLVKEKEFSSYFIIQKMMVDAARQRCIELYGGTGSAARGPGRGCLAPESKIVLSDGTTKCIKEIVVGDSVVTKDGTNQKVIQTHCYDVKEDLLQIQCYYGERSGIVLTKDHKILAEKLVRPINWDNNKTNNKKRRQCVPPTGNMQWIKANELNIGDWVFVPNRKINSSKQNKIDLNEFSNGKDLCCDDNFAYHNVINGLTHRINRIKKSNRFIEMDNDWFRILGMFAGDGWLKSNNDTIVGFCFHGNDDSGLDFLISYFKKNKFEDWNIRKSKEGMLVQVQNRFLQVLFKQLHPHYKFKANTKHVPDIVLNASNEHILSYLKGYGAADGHCGQNKYTFTTVSRMLADQIRCLCWKVGLPASLGYDLHGMKDKRVEYSNCQMAYTINIPKKQISGAESLKNYFYYPHKNGVLLKIRKIDIVNDVDKVYDLSVENNSNYLTSSFLVHNSGAGFMLNYLLGITDVDPVKYDLLSSRFLSPARGGKQMCIRFEGNPL